MSTTFPANARGTRGYRRREVDIFLARARAAYDRDTDKVPEFSAEDLRQQSFTLVSRGYDAAAVDQALDRLEDAFSLREREEALVVMGQERWLANTRESAQVILDRLSRHEGARFKRAGRLSHGYSVPEVDRFTDLISDYFQHDQPLAVPDVRAVVFASERHGYSEAQVDRLLDDVVRVMLAVR